MSAETDGGGEFRVEDRRRFVHGREVESAAEPAADRPAGVVEECRRRAEQAEATLQEYIAAFKERERDQDAFRARITADVERRVELRFGELVQDLLATVDDLERALAHAEGIEPARPLAEGVALARDHFLAALDRHGVRPVSPQGERFDPNVAEAVRVDAVDSPEQDGAVTQTLRPGYALGDRVIRPAQVAVGRHGDRSS